MKHVIAMLLILMLAGCAAPQTPQPEPASPAEPTPAIEVSPAPAPEPAPVPQAPVIAQAPPAAPGPTMAKDPIMLKQGSFHKVVHPTDGIVRIYQQPDGDKTLNFLGFDTVPGPGLTIVLHSGDVKDGFVVSTLTSASGNYPYNLPKSLEVNAYTHVAIYNAKYNVIYGEADLR